MVDDISAFFEDHEEEVTAPKQPEQPPSPEAVAPTPPLPSKPPTTVAPESIKAAAYTFRAIGSPLLAAVIEVRALIQDAPGTSKQENDAAAFSSLLSSTVELGRAAAEKIAPSASTDEGKWARCMLAGAASSIVAAHYRATGKPSLPAGMISLVLAAQQAVVPLGANPPSPEGAAQASATSTATFNAKILTAFSPVVSAITRYAFGRQEKALMAEITTKLQGAALELTKAICGDNPSVEDWRTVFGTAMDVVGHLYAESHYTEADRLVDMTPEDRKVYLAKNNNQVPMEPVWKLFSQGVAILLSVTREIKVPAVPGLPDTGEVT